MRPVKSAFVVCAAVSALCWGASGAGNSAVADAAMRGDRPAVEALLRQKADVNAPQADGATAIQWAAYRNDLVLADLLIQAGADVKAANHDGATPLSLAAENGSAAMIERLIEAGADPNERRPNGETPLMMASRNGNVAAIKVLLDHKADVNAKENLRGTTALMWAAEQSHPEAVKVLIEHGADKAAASNPDTRNSRLNIAPTVQQRAQSAQGAGGLGAFARARARTARAGSRGGAASPDDAFDAFEAFFRGPQVKDGGGLTPLVYAAREGCLECARVLVEAGADVNQVTLYGWTPLLTATQNRHYKLAAYLLDHGANPNLANKGGWTPLYLATDNRNIESGDYPVRKPDMDHLEYIKLLLDHGADVNARMKDSTETRTVFTNQWLDENGATAFLRASQSGDIELMKLLLAHGADPKIDTVLHVTALQVAAGIGWVEGITYEWSPQATYEACKMLIDLGLDVNAQADTGRTALHGAAHKGRTDVIQILYDHGAKLDVRDYGNTDNRGGKLAIHTWQPVDYADGLVRVGVQSAIAHPEDGCLLRKLMSARGLPAPPVGRTLWSFFIA